MLVRKCNNCKREFKNGDTVYVVKRKRGVNETTQSGCFLTTDNTEYYSELCESCNSAVNNALKSIAEGEGK